MTYKETMTAEAPEQLLTKTANKLNRIYGTAGPLEEKLVEMIENEEIDPKGDVKVRTEKLTSQFNWDKNDAIKIWCFGPEDTGANLLVDRTTGAQYLNEIKDSIVSSFQYSSKAGVLAEEPMRGCRFNINDTSVHQDPAHRGGGQIMPAARRLFHGLQLASEPTLLEPVFLCQITAPSQSLGGVYKTLNQRRGEVVEEGNVEGSPLHIVKAYVPAAETFGFSTVLRENTHGTAFPQNSFDHWTPISGIPFIDHKATEIVMDIRKRKGMKQEEPILSNYVDKL